VGKASGGDESDTLGSPFVVVHAVSLGSCMMCWTAASDKGTDMVSVVREEPYRRTAEERAESRSIRVNAVLMDKSTRKD
jgi:hypothetical protein